MTKQDRRFAENAKIFHTTIFRLTALYVGAFTAMLGILGIIGYHGTSIFMRQNLDQSVLHAMTSLKQAYVAGGVVRLTEKVNERERAPVNSPLFYLVLNSKGERITGGLEAAPTHFGWSDANHVDEADGDIDHLRILYETLSDDIRLAVGVDLEAVESKEHTLLGALVSAFFAVVLLGSIGGVGLSLALFKRVENIRQTAEAIIAGDLSQRIFVRGSGDDLDHLSQTLNRMLDRISELMDSLRQVSADIAHDLKTPLARLRHRLESAQASVHFGNSNEAELESAIVQVDEILATFSALLRIAQIESGTRRSGFRDIDLSGLFQTIVEAFEPAAEDVQKRIAINISPDIRFFGDAELLTQMVANIVENAVRHTPSGTLISVSLQNHTPFVVGIVSDNGPGVSEGQRERIFQRFYRVESSRSTPGNGLGLSLVKAIADLHGIELEIRSGEPGLIVGMRFPA